MTIMDDVLHQYMAAMINGRPGLRDEPSPLDDKVVRHASDAAILGTVIGPSTLDGFVWVRREDTTPPWSLHRMSELREVHSD
jgi:hypothetical protein